MAQGICNPVEFNFRCPLQNGLHARPATQLAEFAGGLAAELRLTNLRNGASANLKSPLSIISAEIRLGDECSVRITGSEEEVGLRSLREYVARDLPLSDEPLLEPVGNRSNGVLPRSLESASTNCFFGLAVSPGIGKGKAVVIGGMTLPAELSAERAEDPSKEERRVDLAFAALRERIKGMLARSMSPAEAGVLKAHLAIVDDVSFSQKLSELVAQGSSAGQAIFEGGKFFIELLQRSDSAYIRERAIDIQEICLHLLEEIYQSNLTIANVELHEPSIVVAETLAPQQLLTLRREWLKGLVLEYAGTTSHAVILARSLGLPTVVGVKDAPVVFPAGQELVVDATRGLVIANGTAAVRRFYEREQRTLERRRVALARHTHSSAATVDGHGLEVAANVSSNQEVELAIASGADAIGLFRTEMLFVGRDRAPSEEEQFLTYREAARVAGGRSVIVRTMDIGGDKPVPHLNLPNETNPFLGYRGMRIYAEHQELFRGQLRAILRASAFGRIQIMAPMVSSLEEVLWLKSQIAELRGELERQSLAFDPGMPVGIMIEVPSVAFILDQLCDEVDFFSIGTNDLNQYFLAVDRDNAKVAALSNVRHPSFLRFLKHIVDDIHKNGKWVGMCGEMAGDRRNLPILIALGLDEISVPGSQIPAIKNDISRLSSSECEELFARALASRNVEGVENILRDRDTEDQPKPLLDPELILVDSECESKEEVIRELIDLLYIAGRTDDLDRLEQVVWARETVYSTGLGHGFAIPHCRSDAVRVNSIAILKLRRPIPWGSIDDQPVGIVILLAIRESDANNRHMQVLAKMARKLMTEEFRQRILDLSDPKQILAYFSKELDIPL